MNVALRAPRGDAYGFVVARNLGLVDSLAHITRSHFTTDDDAIILLGENTDEIGGSEYLQRIHGVVAGRPPGFLRARSSSTCCCFCRISAVVVRSAAPARFISRVYNGSAM